MERVTNQNLRAVVVIHPEEIYIKIRKAFNFRRVNQFIQLWIKKIKSQDNRFLDY
jgi:hypothetical protein